MAKFGRGINREIVAAVNSGIISEPFTIDDVRTLIRIMGWKPEPSEAYAKVTLENGSNDHNGHNYVKYFLSLGKGMYRLRPEYKGPHYV